jgi:hypothetical protein
MLGDDAAIARQNPIVDGICRFCGSEDPIDRPVRHQPNCEHLRALVAMDERWEQDEGWRVAVLERLAAISTGLRIGQPADRHAVEAAVTDLEAAATDDTHQ